jgi:hypothetical protein
LPTLAIKKFATLLSISPFLPTSPKIPLLFQP